IHSPLQVRSLWRMSSAFKDFHRNFTENMTLISASALHPLSGIALPTRLHLSGSVPRRRNKHLSKRPREPDTLPSRDAILAFIRERPGKTGTREIARAFNLKNADRI